MRSFVTDVSNQTQRQTVHQLTLTSVCVSLVIHIKGHCNSGVQKQEVVSLVSLVISSFRSFHFFFSLAETGRWLGRLFWGFWGFWLPSAPQPPSGGGDGDESSKQTNVFVWPCHDGVFCRKMTGNESERFTMWLSREGDKNKKQN